MISLLLGPDDFSKKEYIRALAEKTKADLVMFTGEDPLPSAEELSQQDLFSMAKVFVLSSGVDKYNQTSILEQLIASKNEIIFVLEKLDKRLSANKELLKNSKITVKEFSLPHGKELNKWITERVKNLQGKILADAAELLAIKLGRDEAKETKFGGKVVDVQEIYNLWQADGEIKKLIGLANGREITKEDVENLVSENLEIDAFEVTNAIADGKKDLALNLLHKLLTVENSADEKAGVIQINALLSEQFRNVVVVQSFAEDNVEESAILEKTGWKSGRLFIMKKVAARFPQKKVLEFLNKLAALDFELKTSSTPPKVLLDMIVTQLL